MSMSEDYFGYQGKTVVITGAFSGMGEAATKMLLDLGAEVYALDVREVTSPVKGFISADLLKKDSIDAAIEKLPAKIDSIFSCAGVAGDTYKGASFSPVDVVTINFVAAKYLIEQLVPRMGEGGAIAMIASIAALGWERNLETIMQLVETKGFDEGRAWLETNRDNPQAIATPPGATSNRLAYAFSKQCLVVYAKAQAWDLAANGIRINTLSPGPTQTGMTEDFEALSGKEIFFAATGPKGRYATSEEQAEPLLFLNSNMARYMSGADLQVDYGFVGQLKTGKVQPGR